MSYKEQSQSRFKDRVKKAAVQVAELAGWLTFVREDVVDAFLSGSRPFRMWAMQAAPASTHEQLHDTILGEVYYAHAAIHGPNKLLPANALPHPPEHPRTSETGKFKLA